MFGKRNIMLNINDKKYKNIVKDILRNNDFKKTYYIEHHGISRMEHMIKISFYSYKIARKLGLDYKAVARGGILHDFYLNGDERNYLNKFTDTFTHPNKALNLSTDTFNINEMEKNIIVSHMFPFYISIPKYRESILVNIVDKIIGGYELFNEIKYKTKYKFNYTFLLLIIFITSN